MAAIYDALESDRSDLEVYAAIAEELGARRLLDVGCGTGTFCLLLAERGLAVTGVDPADGSLGRIYTKWFGKAAPEGTAMTTVYEGFGAPGFTGYSK